MSKTTETEEEYSVEKVLNRRVRNGKVSSIKIQSHFGSKHIHFGLKHITFFPQTHKCCLWASKISHLTENVWIEFIEIAYNNRNMRYRWFVFFFSVHIKAIGWHSTILLALLYKLSPSNKHRRTKKVYIKRRRGRTKSEVRIPLVLQNNIQRSVFCIQPI